MKAKLLAIFIIISLTILTSCGNRSKNEVKDHPISEKKSISPEAKTPLSDSASTTKNKKLIQKVSLTENESDFLITAAEGRMMGALEGKAAIKKGTTSEIKNYGQLMIRDQKTMLADLKNLARTLSAVLPDTISSEKQNGLKNLLEKESKKFDRKFVKMMKIDHRRDIKLFTKAKNYDNAKIKAFAAQYLPLIESHLEKAKALRKKKENKSKQSKK